MSAIKANVDLGITGEYRFIVSGGARGTVDLGSTKNMILDSGIDALFSATRTGPDRCWVGTSNAAVVATQTDLQGTKVMTDTVQSTLNSVFVAGPPPYVECVRTYRFTTGVATGTWAEVGTGWNDGTGQARFSRALILPSTVTVLADEQLDVVFTVRFYPSTTDVTGTVTLEGTPTDYTLRFAVWNATPINFLWTFPPFNLPLATTYFGSSQTLDAISATGIGLGSPAGNTSSAVSLVGGYTPGSFTRTFRVTLGLNVGNLAGGIGKLGAEAPMGSQYGFQMTFTPKVNKTATKVLTLDFSISLNRRP